MGIMTAI
jgi:hypothetical protein